jgi:hypothetical protein
MIIFMDLNFKFNKIYHCQYYYYNLEKSTCKHFSHDLIYLENKQFKRENE